MSLDLARPASIRGFGDLFFLSLSLSLFGFCIIWKKNREDVSCVRECFSNAISISQTLAASVTGNTDCIQTLSN